ncbi:MAG TPA: acetyl-CoA C-acetyltransferase [Patescibacteria group bacterium]|nr:acetyl-CoA C-acetyltransferase [Patescibacteria group bacterium]
MRTAPSTSYDDRDVVIAACVRTPIGRFGGALAGLTAAELGAAAARAALHRGGVAGADLDEVIVGCARQAGAGPNVARQVAHRAGVPHAVPAFTVNKACGSGLKSVLLATQSIRLGDASIVLAGGCESMSRVPYYVEGARWGARMGDAPLVDGMYRDGFLCPLCGQLMGQTAENLADKYAISRQEQDRYAALSQNRAEAARLGGMFRDEIEPIEVKQRSGKLVLVEADEHPRDGVTAESLAALPPVFRENGTVHAGNSSGITDGASAAILMTLAEAHRRGLSPLFRVRAWATAGVEPELMGIGPVPAIRSLLEKAGLQISDIDLIEINEAFAAQVLACVKELGIDPARLNVNGGAIALGHPIGASGARVVVTLLHEMARRRARFGIASLCISGGMGIAALFEAVPD